MARRTREDLQFYRRILNNMIQAFRSASPDRIEYLLSVIRSTDSLEEITIALEVNMAEIHREGQLGAHPIPESRAAPPESGPPQGSNPRRRRMVMSIQSLSDEPLFDLPAKPWTTITDDDHFVSHLVSLYFTWEHAACHVIDRELFLEDMQNGQLDSECCSPVLVNALLATACVGAHQDLISPPTLRGDSAFQTTPKPVPCRADRKPGATSFLPKRRDCGNTSAAPTAWPTVAPCA